MCVASYGGNFLNTVETKVFIKSFCVNRCHFSYWYFDGFLWAARMFAFTRCRLAMIHNITDQMNISYSPSPSSQPWSLSALLVYYYVCHGFDPGSASFAGLLISLYRQIFGFYFRDLYFEMTMELRDSRAPSLN